MRYFIFACTGAFMYAALWSEPQAERLAEKRIYISKEILKLKEESQQLESEIKSMMRTMFDEVHIAFIKTHTPEASDYFDNCDLTLWGSHNIMSGSIHPLTKKISDEVNRYSAEHTTPAILHKLIEYKHHVDLDLERSRKNHAIVKELERRCRITNKL